MNQLQEKLKAIIEAGTKKESMLILFLCGILIFVILLPTNSTSYSNKKTETDQDYTETETVISYKEKRETELKTFLESVSGVGEVKVLIYFRDLDESVPTIEGIVVAAKGARDENIRLLIVKLVMALYGVDANKVEVTALVSAQ
jgi:stage III sporulation protein AG